MGTECSFYMVFNQIVTFFVFYVMQFSIYIVFNQIFRSMTKHMGLDSPAWEICNNKRDLLGATELITFYLLDESFAGCYSQNPFVRPKGVRPPRSLCSVCYWCRLQCYHPSIRIFWWTFNL